MRIRKRDVARQRKSVVNVAAGDAGPNQIQPQKQPTATLGEKGIEKPRRMRGFATRDQRSGLFDRVLDREVIHFDTQLRTTGFVTLASLDRTPFFRQTDPYTVDRP